MKISVNWLKQFTNMDLPVDDLVKKIGEQLGEVEQVINLGERYHGITVAKVVSCVPHPNADKLHVCKLDDGGKVPGATRDKDGFVQVVCGAPNVRTGLLVAWLPPGAIVPSTFDGEKFKLDARALRGEISNGMIGSGKELGINDDHDGILEIDKHAEPGTLFADVYELNDHIIEIENKMFTHRPDLFAQLGVAREIAGIQHHKFTSPDWYQKPLDVFDVKGEKLKLEVKNEIPELAPRFMAIAMSGVNIKPSPIGFQSFLYRVGIKPINNVVDVTNFVMMLTAQPLHAYDYDKVAGIDGASHATLTVRKPKKGEQIALLNGKTIEPRAEAAMIASNSKLIGLAGVMGGSDTEVDATTKNIIIECANFNMYSIRKTSMEHGLFTDAVTRFNKGQSALQNEQVLAYAVAWMNKLSGGLVASEPHDNKAHLKSPKTVEVTAAFINERLGLKLSASEIAKLLQNVEFEVEHTADKLKITAPFWRTDIEIPEDIVEEVGRLFGYDHLPLELPSKPINPAAKNEMLEIKTKIRGILASAGANELLTYSFVHGDLLDKVGQDKNNAFQLTNALSPELQYYRQSLLPSLLDKVHANIRAGHNKFALFELNQTHGKDYIDAESKLPIEEHRLGFIFAADQKAAECFSGAPFYQAKRYLVELLSDLGIHDVTFEPATKYAPKMPISKAAIAPFQLERTAIVKTKDGEFIAELGEFRSAVKKNLKLPEFIAGFEADAQQLLKLQTNTNYQPLNKFPKTDQDISLKLASDVDFADVHEVVAETIAIASAEHGYQIAITPIDIYQDAKDAAHKHITLRITLWHPDRTLKTEEANKLLDHIADATHKKLNASRL